MITANLASTVSNNAIVGEFATVVSHISHNIIDLCRYRALHTYFIASLPILKTLLLCAEK
jgi:hypothetical protein